MRRPLRRVKELQRTGAVLLGITMAAVFMAPPAAAQFAPDTRGLGVGGALIGLARGSEAVYWNPANLALPDGPSSSIAIAQPGAVAAAVGPELRDLEILGDSDATAATRATFLADVPATGLELRGDMTVPWLSFSVGSFGFGVSTTALGKVEASRELLRLYLDARADGGLEPGTLAGYRVGDTGYRNAAFTKVTAAYAVPATVAGVPITLGVGARAVFGHRLDRGRLFEPSIRDNHLAISAIALRSGGGRGYGVDVGATARPADGLTLGVAVENAVQRMTWDEELEILGGEFTSRELADEGVDGVLEKFEARSFDPAGAPLEAYGIARELLSEAYLPRVIRLGAGYEWRGTSLGATLSSTVGGGDLRAGWPRYVAVGIEQRLIFLSVRAGYANSLSGASALTAGAGVELGPTRLTVSAARILGSEQRPPASGMLDGSSEGDGYSDRLAAGSGYAVNAGFSLVFF